jgi:hypothetical protein
VKVCLVRVVKVMPLSTALDAVNDGYLGVVRPFIEAVGRFIKIVERYI